ncbi:MAG: NB-ARC domain-containing protein [Armatimonadota bacterium]
MKNPTFGRLLKAGIGSIANIEGKVATIIEDDFGDTLCLSGHAVQRYKSGHLPPEIETIAFLAKQCVKRGLLGSDWARAFLESARYPAIKQLLDELFGEASASPDLKRVYNNLPASKYSRFIPRPQAFVDLREGIEQSLPAVLVRSFGGMGKTSLVREYAKASIDGAAGQRAYDAVVWVSDEFKEGTTQLETVFDTIARTMDYEGYVKLPVDEKGRAVERLLRENRVLLVVDNYETITDSGVATWILNYLPETSKAIITSRVNLNRDIREKAWVIELEGLTKTESDEFVAERLRHLKMGITLETCPELSSLCEVTGGNPFAIQAALGCIKYEHRPVPEVIRELSEAQGSVFEDLIDHLFKRAWNMLWEEQKHVVMSMSMFPKSACPSALSAAAGVPGIDDYGFPAKGSKLDEAVEQLLDLKLLDLEQTSDTGHCIRYSQHPLVRGFAHSQLKNDSTSFQSQARDRMIGWYSDLASGIGFCWNDIARLRILDVEGERDAVEAVLAWAFDAQHYTNVIRIAKGVRYFYYVRGNWSSKTSPSLLRAQAAHMLEDISEEFDALVYHINVASKQGDLDEVGKHLDRIETLSTHECISPTQMIDYQHARALYYLAAGRLDEAKALWDKNLSMADGLPHEVLNANRRWSALCLYQMGQLDQARSLFEELLDDAQRHGFTRGTLAAMVKLAVIALDSGDDVAAEALLAKARNEEALIREPMQQAEICEQESRLHEIRGNRAAAAELLATAINLFERLGCSSRLQAAQNRMADLSTSL